MGYEELTTERLDDRIEYLADKITNLWKKLEPFMIEWNESKKEFEDLVAERFKRTHGEQNQPGEES